MCHWRVSLHSENLRGSSFSGWTGGSGCLFLNVEMCVILM